MFEELNNGSYDELKEGFLTTLFNWNQKILTKWKRIFDNIHPTFVQLNAKRAELEYS